MEKNSEIRVGIFGLGGRGRGLLRNMVHIEGIQITALCDLYEERVERGKVIIEQAGRPAPLFTTADYRELIDCPDVDVVMIFAAWL